MPHPSENCPNNKIVKCNCGMILRQHAWSAHWRSCYQGGQHPDPVTQDDINAVLHHEQHMRSVHGIEKLGRLVPQLTPT
jgi:hypothetical protein